MTTDSLSEKVRSLLLTFDIEARSWRRLKGGRNSLVWKVVTEKKTYVVKEYRIENTGRPNLLEVEFSFVEFLHRHGINNVPKPLHKSPIENVGIYSFIEGRPVEKVTDSLVKECAEFIHNINCLRNKEDARKLVNGAEAFFAIQDHLDCVWNRLKQLAEASSKLKDYRIVREFVRNDLIPKFTGIKDNILQLTNIDELTEELCEEKRIISPSDFGFHNVLVSSDKVYFLDFEYAGWDDPAKLCCDFACQVNYPISKQKKDIFIAEMTRRLNMPAVKERASLLEPLYKLKWCCILLNVFKSGGHGRQMRPMGSEKLLLRKQLDASREYFKANVVDM